MFELSGVNYEEVLEQGDSILVRVIAGSSYRGFELSGLYCIYTSKISINGHIVKGLFDSGSSENFIHPNLVKQLALGINPSSCQVTMASTSLSSQVVGAVNVNIKMNDFEYSNVILYIMIL